MPILCPLSAWQNGGVVTTETRRDVQRVKAHDRDFDAHGTVLAARMKAVVDAQRAVAQRELGAGYALRQSRFYQASSSEMFGATPPPQNEQRRSTRASRTPWRR